MLTKEQILSIDDKRVAPVEVPEWGDTVYVRTMTGCERDRVEELIDKAKARGGMSPKNLRGTLCSLCMCDENGVRLFNDAEATALGNRSCVALDRVFTAALKVNGMSQSAQDELAENSDGDPSAGSGSS